MSHLINILIGDMSADGHGKTRSEVYLCNKPATEVEAAYKIGTEKLGFDFREDVASEYEESTITQYQLDRLAEHGCHPDVETSEVEGVYDIYQNEYLEAFLFIVRLGDKELSINQASCEIIDAGGYGLFY